MQFPLADGPPVLPLAGQMILEFTSFSKWSNFAILLSCRLCHHPSNHIKPISHFHNCPSIFHTKQRKKTGFFQPKFMSSSHPSKNGVEERWITKLLSSKVFVRKTKSSVKRWINTSCSRKSPGDFWRCVHIYYVYNSIYIYIYEKLWRCCLIVLLIWSLCFFSWVLVWSSNLKYFCERCMKDGWSLMNRKRGYCLLSLGWFFL